MSLKTTVKNSTHCKYALAMKRVHIDAQPPSTPSRLLVVKPFNNNIQCFMNEHLISLSIYNFPDSY
jgi:hypothetical protein